MASRRPPEPDPYATLGVGRAATPDEIRTAYRRLIKAAHPDVGGSERRAADVNAAYRLLSDPDRRAAWDRAHPLGPPPAAVPRPRGPGPSTVPPRPTGQRPTQPVPPPRTGWSFVLLGAAMIAVLWLVFGAIGTRGGVTSPPGGVERDDPLVITAGDCVDLDGLVPTDVPCDSGRVDGEVVAMAATADGCPDASEAVDGPGDGVLCIDTGGGFEVRGCVDVEGLTAYPTECGPNPDGIVAAIEDDPADCPVNTDVTARLATGRHVCIVVP